MKRNIFPNILLCVVIGLFIVLGVTAYEKFIYNNANPEYVEAEVVAKAYDNGLCLILVEVGTEKLYKVYVKASEFILYPVGEHVLIYEHFGLKIEWRIRE